MKKRHFFSLFREAWAESLTEKNIQSAFEKAEIWPINLKLVISQIQPPRPKTPPPTIDNDSVRTPYTAKGIRQMKKSMKEEPTQEKMDKMFKAINTLQAKASILEHKNKGLENAIQLDKKTKGKKRKLNLQGEDACKAQLWSTEEVLEAQARLQAKDDAEEQEKVDKAQRKANAKAIRKQKEIDKQEKAIQTAVARQLAKEARAWKQIEEREAREAAKKAKAIEKTLKKSQTVAIKAKSLVPKPKSNAQASKPIEVEVEEEGVVETKTRTRVIKPRPQFEYK